MKFKLFAMLILLPSLALASEVVLKSGEKLEGKIVEQTDAYIKMDPGVGEVMTYYSDEIDTIDGQKLQKTVSLPRNQPTSLQDESQPQPGPTLSQAEDLIKKEDYGSALLILNRLIENDPDDAESYYDKAIVQYHDKQYYRALKNLDSAQRLGLDQDTMGLREKILVAQRNRVHHVQRPPQNTYNLHTQSALTDKKVTHPVTGLLALLLILLILFIIFSPVIYLIVGFKKFFSGIAAFHRKRAIENIPTSTIRGIAAGMVEVNGKTTNAKMLVSPFTATPCTYYQYSFYKSEGKNTRLIKGDSVFCPFYLNDGTGQIMVLPQGAEFDIPVSYTYEANIFSKLPQNLVDFLEENRLPLPGFSGGTYYSSFKEWHIKPDEPIFVMGTAQKNTAQMDAADVVISKGDGHQIFIISKESQKEILKKLSTKTSKFIKVGLILIVVCLLLLLSGIFHY